MIPRQITSSFPDSFPPGDERVIFLIKQFFELAAFAR